MAQSVYPAATTAPVPYGATDKIVEGTLVTGMAYAYKSALPAGTYTGVVSGNGSNVGTYKVNSPASFISQSVSNGSEFFITLTTTDNRVNVFPQLTFTTTNAGAVTGLASGPKNGVGMYAEGKYYVAYNNTSYASTNGVSYSSVANGTSGGEIVKFLYNPALTEKYLIACNAATNKLATSTNGTTWTLRTTNTGTSGMRNAAIGPNNSYLITGGNGVLGVSTDGITWTTRTINALQSTEGVAYNESATDKYVAVGSATLVANTLFTSTDSVTWTARGAIFSAAANYANSLEVVNGRYFIFSNNRTQAFYSDDGVTWTSFFSYIPSALTASSAAPYMRQTGNMITFWTGLDYIGYSPDGINWSTSTVGASGSGTLPTVSIYNSANNLLYFYTGSAGTSAYATAPASAVYVSLYNVTSNILS